MRCQSIFSGLMLLCVFATRVSAQPPTIDAVTPDREEVPVYGKFELAISLTANFTNPYDYDQIVLRCTFKSPSGNTYEVDGFYMQDYLLNADGSLETGAESWRVRFAPPETGIWIYTLSCSTATGSVTAEPDTMTCVADTARGFIRKNGSNYLGFDNGDQYIPVGENMCWDNGNIFLNYDNWLTDLAGNKGNFIRLWMPDWSMGLEWKNGANGFGGLKQYKQRSAWFLDLLLDMCRQKGIYIMMCLNHHGQVSTNVNEQWADNPYNAANGGPCVNTWDFFTNATARSVLKNRMRYIVARYGYSVNIMSWELFNEVDWTDQFADHNDAITAWHNEMATYIRLIDLNRHLITTSYAHDNEDPDTWNLPSIDFTQTHHYVQTPNIETVLSAGSMDYLSRYQKPVLNGEFGLGPAGAALSALDPSGVHVHNSIWATAFSGAMGAAMTWWWDSYIEPHDLYLHYKPLSTLLHSLKLKDSNYKPVVTTVAGGGRADLSVSPGAAWGAPTANAFAVTGTGTTPGVTQLGSYLYGNMWNTQYRNPPVFTVNYPVAGQFRVVTGNSTGTAPKINVYLNGNLALNQDAAINTTYSIDVPAGNHTIKVDNLGTDWIFISAYVFTNIGTPLNVYALRSADKTNAAGWIHNKQYNHQYLLDHHAVPPPVVNGASLHIAGMANGAYEVVFSNCSTGQPVDTAMATAAADTLHMALPSVAWDLAFVVKQGSITGIPDLDLAQQIRIFPNPVHNNEVLIEYKLLRPAPVHLDLFDARGTHLKTLFSGTQQAGMQRARYAIAAPAAGIYLVKMQAGNEAAVQKLVITR